MTEKKIIIKAYDSSGGLLGVVTDASDAEFSMSLNGGQGACTLKIAAGFGEAITPLKVGTRVRIEVSDAETATGDTVQPGGVELLYSGKVSRIVRSTAGNGSRVSVDLLGDVTELTQSILRNGSQVVLYSKATVGLTTVSGDQSAADIGDIARAVIDRHVAETAGTNVHYLDGDIPAVGVSVTYTFTAVTVREALDGLASMAEGVSWFMDATGRVTFGAAPTEPTHVLAFGREISAATVERSAEQIANSLLVWNDQPAAPVLELVEDAESIADYGRRMEMVTDSGIASDAAAQAKAAGILAKRKGESVRVTMTVEDSNTAGKGYDIESLRPGDTVRLMNFDSDVAGDTFYDNMTITAVDWSKHRARVTLDLVPVGIVTAIKSQSSAISSLEREGMPETY